MFVPFMLALLSSLPGANDARLNDVCFVDAQHGWAVGDRGVIWATDDGGQQWRLQPSGATGSLGAVRFLNGQFGWAAGGFAHPYTHASTGVLLSTRDGGQTWSGNPNIALPALRRLGFFDPQHGWALGCPSAMYPSGVFVSDDGGRRWRPLPGPAAAGWLAADFLDSRTGALAGRSGALAAVSRGEVQPARAEQLDLRSLVAMRLLPPAHGWLAGDGGAVRMTDDLGSTWRAPPGGLPKAAEQFDFAALAVRGPKCWIAGAPGTRVFYTADAGQSWNVFATGSTVPLRAISFVDDQHGWAAGELGTILATDDGGRTWRQQRAGGARAALLALFADPDDVPLELIARLAGSEGYLTIVDVLARRDVEIAPRDDVPLADRLHEAVVRVGGCAADVAWRFPVRQAGLRLSQQQIVEAWDRVNDGRGIEALQAHVVRQIRLWRPEVIVTHDSSRAGRFSDQYQHSDDSLASLIHQAVLQAVAQAADANAFPAQIADAGLEPWTVKKVYAALPRDARGPNDLSTTQFMPRLGRSLADAAAEPRGLLQDCFALSPPTLGFRLLGDCPDFRALTRSGGPKMGLSPSAALADTAPREQDRRDFSGGIALAPGGPARRELPPAETGGLDLRQRMAQKRRHVQAILERAERTTASVEQLLAQIDDMTRDLDDQSRGQIIYQLADRYYRTGHWPLAAETFQVLSERCPQHSLTPCAMLWLVQYYASGEAAWRVDRGEGQKRFERAAALGQQIERTRPELAAAPGVCFPLAAAYRGLGQARQAERMYQGQSRGGDRDAWRACAQSELHLADPARGRAVAQPPSAVQDRPAQPRAAVLPMVKPMLACAKAETKPRLDGRLDDPVWQQAKPAALQSVQHDDGDWPAAVMLACDSEFLYLAAHCRQKPMAAGASSEIGDGSRVPQRPRDADLSAYDRIEVLLDVDRDFAVYYRLAIDLRGWTNDSCWGDSTWDPKWFVAVKREEGAWTVEAAIPLAELVGRPPRPREVWGIGIQRVAPGVGFQSWTTPAAVSVLPDGFGYLAFP